MDAAPADCAAITTSTSDIESAKAAGVPVIAYAKTSNDAEHQVQGGATAFVYSMADLALRLRSFAQEP